MRRAACVVFATEREREKAQPFLRGVESRVIHWPVEYVDTSMQALARERLRMRHKISHDMKLLLYLGRLHPMKRPLETIEAIGQCADCNLHLLVVGPDSDVLTRAECEQFCIERHIENVHFDEPVYGVEKYDYYMGTDGFINSSHRENFGYTVAEALACGKPVILSLVMT